MAIFDFINKPLGMLLGWVYGLVGSYGLALIIFTVIVRIILAPLAVKQQKSMIQTARLSPVIADIQKRYKHDQQKQSEELMKLYQQEKANPMSGCLPMLIQLPIIIALYTVISRPLVYIVGMTNEAILSAASKLNIADVTEQTLRAKEIIIAQSMYENQSLFPELSGKLIDFNFLGLNLGLTPSISEFSVLWIIPLLAAVTGYLSSYVTMKMSPSAMASAGNPQAQSMNKSMMVTMPLISLFFTFTMPAGIGIYWSISNVLMIFQQFILNKAVPMPTEEEIEELKRTYAKEKKQIQTKPAKKRSIYDDD